MYRHKLILVVSASALQVPAIAERISELMPEYTVMTHEQYEDYIQENIAWYDSKEDQLRKLEQIISTKIEITSLVSHDHWLQESIIGLRCMPALETRMREVSPLFYRKPRDGE